MPHKYMRFGDFEAISEVVRSEVDVDHGVCDAAIVESLTAVTRGLADYFEESNMRFDRTRFYAGCGVDSSGHGRATA